jgi:CRISPR-associated endonuclease/helicase Cas3
MEASDGAIPLAHVAAATVGWREHPLEDHLRKVAARAATMAEPFDAGDWARLAGLWHDLGKYSAEFQAYLRQASGREREEAHIEGPAGRVNHSAAGGLYAVQRCGPAGKVLAQLILAHHAGLYDGQDLAGRLVRDEPWLQKALAAKIPDEILNTPLIGRPHVPGLGTPGAYALWLRLVFSCLVDADFLDTESFMDEAKAQERGGYPDIAALEASLDAHLAHLAANAPPTPVNRARAGILAECRAAAAQSPGLFSLTVPTGGGKTLSGMAFALAHARRHGLRRVIHVIPYTSIIEQTADVFRGIFGGAVIEHHSSVEPEREDARARLACENWDAPIVVTTSVQFFESLFAARTSRCRKLHNIVDAVVVLDEAQLLPPAFLQPILDVLNLLTRHYGVTVVLSTATQPALASRQWFGGGLQGLDAFREIIADPDALYAMLKRVDVRLPADLTSPRDWDDIAAEIAARDTDVLAIVNRRTHARELHLRLPADTRHLSALMCGAHRSAAIAGIRQALEARRRDPGLPPVRVVSTQLVEAGVDLDFPVVYRALAGLDSIAQAAGRCNREGRLDRGEVYVFVPPQPSPPGLLRQGEQATVGLLAGHEGDPLQRQLFEAYFERLYRGAELDARGIRGWLEPDRDSFGCVGLRRAADAFQLIDNEESGYRSVFVPYRRDGEDNTFAELLALLRKNGPARWLMRRLQRYAVSLPGRQFDALLRRGDIEEIRPGLFALKSEAQYHPVLGLLVDEPLSAAALFG